MHTLSSQGLGSHLRLSKISVLYTHLYWSILIKSKPCLGSPPEVESPLNWHTFGNCYIKFPRFSYLLLSPQILVNKPGRNMPLRDSFYAIKASLLEKASALYTLPLILSTLGRRITLNGFRQKLVVFHQL